jgi:hypothetical protein
MKPRPYVILPALALAAASAVAAWSPGGRGEAVAAKAPSSARSCFLPRQVDGFNAVDRDTVNVTIGPRQVYQLELFGTCPDVDFSQRIGIRSTHGSSWVCQGFDAELIVPGPSGVDRCPVTSIRKLSEAEVTALRSKRKH